jgi:hypothetical protein
MTSRTSRPAKPPTPPDQPDPKAITPFSPFIEGGRLDIAKELASMLDQFKKENKLKQAARTVDQPG